MSSLKRTPLFNAHKKAGAKFVEFAGWEMPIHYGSILEEAKVVRASCGMFDVSHMGRVFVQTHKEWDEGRGAQDEGKGSDVAEALDRLVTMEIKSMVVGRVRYGFLCNERGGVIDDLTVARLGDREFLAIVNAARSETDFTWMRQNLPEEVSLIDRTYETAMIAVQGPDAIAVVDELADDGKKPSSLRRFRIDSFSLVGVECLVSRTGYTGEDGVEIICPSDAAECIWDALLTKGVQPCGLGARDILRLEAGMCLYGHDLNEDITPVEADLMQFVAMSKSFIGKDAIERQMREGIKRKRVGLKLFTKSTAREGAQVLADGQPVGIVTSGVFSPHLNTAIAMAYVAIEWANIGTKVQVLVREKPHDAEIVSMPFLPLPSRKAVQL